MEKYAQLFLLFYRKVSAQHPQKAALVRQLHSVLRKCQLVENDSQDHLSVPKSKRDEHPSPNKRSEVDRSLLKRGEEEWGLEWLFVAHTFQQNLVFAVLNHLIEHDDFLNFKCLEEKLNVLLEESGLAEETMRVISYQWFRIGQIMLNKRRVRWEKLLSEAVHNFPPQFDNLFARIFEGEGRYNERHQQILAEISALIKAKIVYFEIEGRRMLENQSFGLGETEIYVCFLSDLNKHIVCSKRPHQSQQSKQKEQALEQLRLGFASLLQEYSQGTANMTGLANLSGVKLNEMKVMAYLGKK